MKGVMQKWIGEYNVSDFAKVFIDIIPMVDRSQPDSQPLEPTIYTSLSWSPTTAATALSVERDVVCVACQPCNTISSMLLDTYGHA